jgi:hypothetical protein
MNGLESARRVARQAHRKDRALARLACHGHVAPHHARAGDGNAAQRAGLRGVKSHLGSGPLYASDHERRAIDRYARVGSGLYPKGSSHELGDRWQLA